MDYLYFSWWCAIPSAFPSFWYRTWPESMSVARPPLSPSQPIWAELWDGRDASEKCQRSIGLDGVAGAGLSWMCSGQRCRVAVPGWYRGGRWGPCLLGAKGKGCDVLRVHHMGGPGGPGEGGTVPGWRNGGLVKVSKAKQCTSALGWNSPRHQCVLEAAQLENSLAEKALGVLVDTQVEHNLELHCQQGEQGALPLHSAYSWSGGLTSGLSEQEMGNQEGCKSISM